MPIAAIIDSTLLRNLEPEAAEMSKKPNHKFMNAERANLLINDAINNDNWGKIERMSGPLITYFN